MHFVRPKTTKKDIFEKGQNQSFLIHSIHTIRQETNDI